MKFQKSMLGFVYLPFIVILVLAIVFISIMVPETKNKTFEEIISELKGAKSPLKYDVDDGEELQSMNKA